MFRASSEIAVAMSAWSVGVKPLFRHKADRPVIIEDASQVSASVTDRQLSLSVCIDPRPRGRVLAADDYTLKIRIDQDPTVVSLRLPVLIGRAPGRSYFATSIFIAEGIIIVSYVALLALLREYKLRATSWRKVTVIAIAACALLYTIDQHAKSIEAYKWSFGLDGILALGRGFIFTGFPLFQTGLLGVGALVAVTRKFFEDRAPEPPAADARQSHPEHLKDQSQPKHPVVAP